MNLTPEPKTQPYEDAIPLIWKAFEGQDERYVEIVKNYHATATDTSRTQEFKQQSFKAAKQSVVELKKEFAAKATAVIDAIVEQYSTKAPEPAAPKSPIPDPGNSSLTNYERWQANAMRTTADLLQRMIETQERTNLFMTLPLLLSGMDADGLMEFYDTNKFDTEVLYFLAAELGNRPETGHADSPKIRELKKLIAEGYTANDSFPKLDQIRRAVNAYITSGDTYTPGMHLITDIRDWPKPRTVSKDLEAFPINQGATFRPGLTLESLYR